MDALSFWDVYVVKGLGYLVAIDFLLLFILFCGALKLSIGKGPSKDRQS